LIVGNSQNFGLNRNERTECPVSCKLLDMVWNYYKNLKIKLLVIDDKSC